MGLIKAALGAAGGVLSDQWKEYFYCDAIPADIIMVKGQKRTTGRGSNNGGDNIISDGSVITVADGQCMIIVEQGKVVDICAEPGEFVYDISTEPSIFSGSLSETVPEILKNIGKRFTFGGDAPKDQRVYYFNTKELMGNKYGTPGPVPFRVVDQRAGIDIDISLRCFGEYTYRVTNPILFYTNVCGNAATSYSRDEIDSTLKNAVLTNLQPALARLSAMGIRYSELPAHARELGNALNAVLSEDWRDKRGIEIVDFFVSSMKADEEDEKMLKQMQRDAAYVDPALGNATLVGARAQAMKDAANNAGGAAVGFMGLNMAQQGAGETQAMYQMLAQQQQQQAAAPAAAAAPAGWTCPSCGHTGNSGKFCGECGAAKPVEAAGWTCPTCGANNKGKFCSECGAKKPEAASLYKCDKCGWEPEDPANPPKFCPECGDPFNSADIK